MAAPLDGVGFGQPPGCMDVEQELQKHDIYISLIFKRHRNYEVQNLCTSDIVRPIHSKEEGRYM